MKKFIELVKIFLQRTFKQNGIASLVMPILMIALVVVLSTGSSGKARTAVIIQDQGEHAQELFDAYPDAEDIAQLEEMDKAKKNISEQSLDQVYIFPEDFSQKIEAGEVPQITVLTRDASSSGDINFSLYLGKDMRERVNKAYLKQEDIEYQGIIGDYKLEVENKDSTSEEGLIGMMLSFSILYGSAFFANDFINLKKNKVLRRGLATPTHGKVLLASNMTGAWLLQVVSNLIALGLVSIFLDVSPKRFVIIGVMILVLSFFSVCLQLLLLRIFKDPSMASFTAMFLTIFLMFLGMLSSLKEVLSNLPSFVFKLSYLSPFHWVEEAISGKSLLLSTAVIFGLGLCLFFSGSSRLEDFAE